MYLLYLTLRFFVVVSVSVSLCLSLSLWCDARYISDQSKYLLGAGNVFIASEPAGTISGTEIGGFTPDSVSQQKHGWYIHKHEDWLA